MADTEQPVEVTSNTKRAGKAIPEKRKLAREAQKKALIEAYNQQVTSNTKRAGKAIAEKRRLAREAQKKALIEA